LDLEQKGGKFLELPQTTNGFPSCLVKPIPNKRTLGKLTWEMEIQFFKGGPLERESHQPSLIGSLGNPLELESFQL